MLEGIDLLLSTLMGLLLVAIFVVAIGLTIHNFYVITIALWRKWKGTEYHERR